MSYSIKKTFLEENGVELSVVTDNGVTHVTHVGKFFVSPTSNCQLSVFGGFQQVLQFFKKSNIDYAIKNKDQRDALKKEFIQYIKSASTAFFVIDIRVEYKELLDSIFNYGIAVKELTTTYKSTNGSNMFFAAIDSRTIAFK